MGKDFVYDIVERERLTEESKEGDAKESRTVTNLSEVDVEEGSPTAPLEEVIEPPQPQPPPSAPTNPTWAFEPDECLGRTPLHYAAWAGNKEKGLKCTKLILEAISLGVHPANVVSTLRRLVNVVDFNQETALLLAARNEATMIVKELLIHHAELDVQLVNGKCGLQEIYKRTPEAMNEALCHSISYVELCKRHKTGDNGEKKHDAKKKPTREAEPEKEKELDFSKRSLVNICLNFFPLLGAKVRDGKGKNGNPVPETVFLYKINRKRMASDVRRQILTNVLVQSFLHFNCPCIAIANVNHSLNGSDDDDKDPSENECPMVMPYGTCEITGVVHIASALILILSVCVCVKEFFQFCRLRTLYIRFENMAQCVLLTFIYLSVPNLYLNHFSVISPVHYQLAAVKREPSPGGAFPPFENCPVCGTKYNGSLWHVEVYDVCGHRKCHDCALSQTRICEECEKEKEDKPYYWYPDDYPDYLKVTHGDVKWGEEDTEED
ncbi:unnamed protein product [Orchesella dallaii]|uniref:RING-type domain-containing protein n=1 Tax=Orchesella dallaii TaxID=48710 RepID=A0ABP1RRQ0_9HEXA